MVLVVIKLIQNKKIEISECERLPISHYLIANKIMNFKRILFSAIMTALASMMIALAVAEISQRVHRTKIVVITGVTIGFFIGAFYEIVNQRKNEVNDQINDNENS